MALLYLSGFYYSAHKYLPSLYFISYKLFCRLDLIYLCACPNRQSPGNKLPGFAFPLFLFIISRFIASLFINLPLILNLPPSQLFGFPNHRAKLHLVCHSWLWLFPSNARVVSCVCYIMLSNKLQLIQPRGPPQIPQSTEVTARK